jgi:hypothetical protein
MARLDSCPEEAVAWGKVRIFLVFDDLTAIGVLTDE